jgi:hypothetical protein
MKVKIMAKNKHDYEFTCNEVVIKNNMIILRNQKTPFITEDIVGFNIDEIIYWKKIKEEPKS